MRRGSRTTLPVLVVLLVTAAVSLAAEELETSVDTALAEIEAQRALVEASPEDLDLLIELGNLYYESGMENEALTTYLRAVNVDSMHAGVHTNLGSLYTDMGNFDKAEAALLKAAELDPGNSMVWTNLGTMNYARRKYTDAVNMYRRALEADPNSVEAHFNLAVAFADAQIFEEAIREWRKVIELDPESRVAQISRDNIDMIEEFRGGK